ncbi:hypothetical protein LCGC14_2418220, partial [marine sediment metagenome]
PEPDPEPDPAPDPAPDDAVPGVAVTGRTVSFSGGLRLLVTGTDLADTIVVGQTSGGLVLSGSATAAFDGSFQSVVIYGFGGDDTIRLANSVTGASVIYAGAGSDDVFDAGLGAGELHGGDGDDLLISIGGGSDTVWGDAGDDSFWVDSSDSISDASSAETAAKKVHRVSEFYQPWTSNSGSADYVSLEITGQDMKDPTLTSSAYHYSDFSSRPLFNGITYDDSTQGYIGDCYFLAALSSMAVTDPGVIAESITALGDGTYAVRFYQGSQEVYLRIDGELPVRSGGSLIYAGLGEGGDIWMPLMEKAYAHFRYGSNSYSSIEGGWMGTVYAQITGRGYVNRSVYSATADATFQWIQGRFDGGHAVTAGTWLGGGPIIGSHAYVVTSLETVEGQDFVTVFNPWGVDGRSYDSNYSDGLLKLTSAQFSQYFYRLQSSVA